MAARDQAFDAEGEAGCRHGAIVVFWHEVADQTVISASAADLDMGVCAIPGVDLEGDAGVVLMRTHHAKTERPKVCSTSTSSCSSPSRAAFVLAGLFTTLRYATGSTHRGTRLTLGPFLYAGCFLALFQR